MSPSIVSESDWCSEIIIRVSGYELGPEIDRYNSFATFVPETFMMSALQHPISRIVTNIYNTK